MVRRLVEIALSNRILVVVLAVVLLLAGLAAFRRIPIEAYPNPVPPLVEVIAQPPGWSAEETERYVTIPLEIGLSGMSGLDHIRSQSLFGLTDVKCYFKWGTDYWAVRQEVINRLQFIQLPQGITAQISPWNSIGEVFRYNLRGKGYSLIDLKAAEDWILERQWKQVPGVVDVTSFGGLTKEYHVEVDPYLLRARGATLTQLSAALANANQNVGGQRVTLGQQAYTVRGIGLIGSLEDIENTVILEQRGVPVRVRDVAKVSIGNAPRLGMVGRDGDDDVVQGTILMKYGAETASTLKGIYDRVDYIRENHLLPPGMEIESFYDRGQLTKLTTHTVLENLLLGMALVTFVLVLFLNNVRAALVTAINIPLALLVAFIGMVATGTPANLISLGAVDFGIVVDSTVIMMENVFRHLGGRGNASTVQRIAVASSEVGRPMAFSTVIIAVAFLPLFTLTGVSGVIFAPMSHTYALAIGGAVVLALTLTPVLASWVFRDAPALGATGRGQARALSQLFSAHIAEDEESSNPIMRVLHLVYNPFFDATLRRPKLAIVIAVVPILACIVFFPLLGKEFMPKLEEGNFWIRATLPTSVSLEESSRHVARMRQILRGHPEVITVASQLGRPDDGTDVTGFQNLEFFAPLKPFDEWPRGLTKEKLTARLQEDLQREFPGVVFNFSQYISDNVEEALSGVKGENSVKVMGPDIRGNEAVGDSVLATMEKVRGVEDPGVIRSMGQPSIKIIPDRVQCSRYGLNTGDVEAVVQAAIGGQAVTQVFEGEKSFALTIRWLPQYRSDVSTIRNITVSSPDGSQIPLGQLATIAIEDSPSVVYREDGRRYTPVKFSVRGRDLNSTIQESVQKIGSAVRLSPETRLVWAGEINELREAEGRLLLIVPLTLLLISFLVFSAVRNWIDTLIVLINIPVACSGGILALLAVRENLSVSAAMGFISIFGIAVQDGLVMVTYFQQQYATGLSYVQAARHAAERRFRPVLMTTLVAMLGLLPAALSHGIGSQTQKPLAIVVIGGSLVLAALTRVLKPPLLVLAHRRFPYPDDTPAVKPLPRARAREIVVVLEHLGAQGGQEDLSKLALDTHQEPGHLA
ncbi:MAG TPA: efflux RND transporter permease subunit, partial [Anaeromyxobacteraceae bacterium]|nr:efflux RND transporter permease subunit [Anaeromyxobacteraceae bacterium]